MGWQSARVEGILASAFEANALGVDMLKVEFPGYVDSQPGRDNVVAACKELDAGVTGARARLDELNEITRAHGRPYLAAHPLADVTQAMADGWFERWHPAG